jgi:hypothetical protein
VCRSPGHDRWDRCRARPAGVWSVAGRSATAPASPSTGHARRVTSMRSQHGGRLDSAHQLAQRTAQVAQATAEAEMVRYAGGVALLDAPHSTPTTYAAWLCAKKTRYGCSSSSVQQLHRPVCRNSLHLQRADNPSRTQISGRLYTLLALYRDTVPMSTNGWYSKHIIKRRHTCSQDGHSWQWCSPPG